MASRFTRVLLFLIIGVSVGCAENKLRTYMVIPAPAVQSKKKGEIQLSAQPLLLTMTSPESDDLENLAEDLKLSSPQKYHRLPPLTFMRFEFENTSPQPWKLNLMQAFFLEPGGRAFRAVSAKEYAERYTSVAYEFFRYDAMYTAYTTRRGKEKPGENFWFDKAGAGAELTLAPGEAGFHVVPFEFIPAGTEELVLHYPAEGKALRQLKIRLVTERGS